jgi:hypothetical protein
MLVSGPKIGTPVLLLGEAKGLIVRSDGVKRMKGTFENVGYVHWKKGDDGMPTSMEETFPMMQYFGRRLRGRKGVLEGVVEVG